MSAVTCPHQALTVTRGTQATQLQPSRHPTAEQIVRIVALRCTPHHHQVTWRDIQVARLANLKP
jgi:hypothetical protein